MELVGCAAIGGKDMTDILLFLIVLVLAFGYQGFDHRKELQDIRNELRAISNTLKEIANGKK